MGPESSKQGNMGNILRAFSAMLFRGGEKIQHKTDFASSLLYVSETRDTLAPYCYLGPLGAMFSILYSESSQCGSNLHVASPLHKGAGSNPMVFQCEQGILRVFPFIS